MVRQGIGAKVACSRRQPRAIKTTAKVHGANQSPNKADVLSANAQQLISTKIVIVLKLAPSSWLNPTKVKQDVWPATWPDWPKRMQQESEAPILTNRRPVAFFSTSNSNKWGRLWLAPLELSGMVPLWSLINYANLHLIHCSKSVSPTKASSHNFKSGELFINGDFGLTNSTLKTIEQQTKRSEKPADGKSREDRIALFALIGPICAA